MLFVLLLGVPALPLPTGGATHVFELIAGLLALQLIVGRRKVWLPDRWRKLELAGPRQQKFIGGLMRMIRRLERFSRPRFAVLLHHRLTRPLFGLLVLGGTAGAFFAPPFTGLDTLPSLGVVLLALGFLLGDALIAIVGVAVGLAASCSKSCSARPRSTACERSSRAASDAACEGPPGNPEFILKLIRSSL